MKFLLGIIAFTVLLQVCRADDFHLEYYAEVTLSCDAETYNISNTPAIVKRYWMFPNGDLIDDQSDLSDSERLSLGSNFNLTIQKLDDPDFGYYYCMMVRSDNTLERIKHGVNVDGADYSGLLEKYRKNAIVGGIAAGVLFVIVAGFCAVSHLKYQRKTERNQAVDELDKAIDGYDLKNYDNVGFSGDDSETQPGANGTQTSDVTLEMKTIDDKF